MPKRASKKPAEHKAPGKRHRQPPPTVTGARKSDLTIPKSMLAEQARRKPHA